jgi:hypothetical protein
MISLLIVLAASCGNPEIINKTKEWNAIDQKTLQGAIKRCPELYDDAPCLKKFIKQSDNNYWAICGALRK